MHLNKVHEIERKRPLHIVVASPLKQKVFDFILYYFLARFMHFFQRISF
jgi:hypothetical protein